MCAQNNGECQQLCLFRGNGQRTCACAHGMLSDDGVSCRDYDGYLLYSERTILKSIHLSDENNLNAPIKPFEDAEHMKNVIALAFDYRYGSKGSNRIFYSDIHFGNIQQINDDGTGRKTIVESEWCPQAPLFVLPSPPPASSLFLFWSLGSVFWWVWRYGLSCEVSEEALEVDTGTGSSLQSSFWHGERVTRLGLQKRALQQSWVWFCALTPLPRQRPELGPSGCPALASPPALTLRLVGFIGTCGSFKEP